VCACCCVHALACVSAPVRECSSASVRQCASASVRGRKPQKWQYSQPLLSSRPSSPSRPFLSDTCVWPCSEALVPYLVASTRQILVLARQLLVLARQLLVVLEPLNKVELCERLACEVCDRVAVAPHLQHRSSTERAVEESLLQLHLYRISCSSKNINIALTEAY
jgi:hypothetical protein